MTASPRQARARESVRIETYAPERKQAWDAFVAGAKNGSFLFFRDYMEYHADRFPDRSLVMTRDDKILAVVPGNAHGVTYITHGGLTFGGLVSDGRMRTPLMLDVFTGLRESLAEAGFEKLVYKAVPHIYHRHPAEEDLYALSRNGAKLVRRDASSAIDNRDRLAFSKGRRWGVKQARRHGVTVQESTDFETFMRIEERLLREKYGARPTHSPGELDMLATRFPESIRLFAAYHGEKMVAGVVVYSSDVVAHAQYIAATDEGKDVSALDLVLEHVITREFADRRYFDFGISTEDEGRFLNIPLIENKEGFGARTVVYDFYEVDLR